MINSRPLILLLFTGFFLGLSSSFAKLAGRYHIDPTAYIMWSCLGASIVLTLFYLKKNFASKLTKELLSYVSIAAFLSLAAPNFLFFSAIKHIGSGFVSLVISLPPVLTYAVSLILKLEKIELKRALGVALALMGGIILAIFKIKEGVALDWTIAAFLGAIFLSIGNIYRTLKWPKGQSPEVLAPAMLVSAFFILFLFCLVLGNLPMIPLQVNTFGLITIQSVTFAFQYIFFFRLQKMNGPVYLSFIGSVAALFAVPIAVFLLGEAVPKGLFVGGPLILMGVLISSKRR